QGLFILLLALIGYLQHFGFIWAITLGICGGLFIWQYGHCNDRQAQHCTESFLHNHKVGMVIFLGLVLSLLFKI
ncbi:MAG: 4-hydroxybenzoate octaprenyltransferase, partial [Pseudomonadales bacterium]|nr:4-hydroxybenzoate octaprenyltransferase [Pseudomonadales bacterium]